MLKIRKVHILSRHLFNKADHKAGIFFKGKDDGMDWLWNLIEETIELYTSDTLEFIKRGGVWSSTNTPRKVILKMPQATTVGVDIGVDRRMVTGLLIVYDCIKQTVITSLPCLINNRFTEPEEDDGWDSWHKPK